MDVREPTGGERRRAAELWLERWVFPRVISRGRLHEPMAYPMLVAVDEGEIAGALTYEVRDGELEVVTLDAFVAGVGAGGALLAAAASEARRQGCRRMWLITSNDNTPAIRFYQRRDMRLVAVHRDSLEEPRKLKPEIPATGFDGIPIRDEIEFELRLDD